MEIDIPDLEDLRFVKKCSWCEGAKRYNRRKDGMGISIPYDGTGDTICERCEGVGLELTDVGKRLLAFLKASRVICDDNGWKLMNPKADLDF